MAAAYGGLARTVVSNADPDEAAKRALGELAAHRAAGGHLPDAREQLRNVLSGDGEERWYYIKQAKALLDDAMEGPHNTATFRRTIDSRSILDLEVGETVAVLMERQADADGHDSVEAWALTQLQRVLNDIHDSEGSVTVDGSVPWAFVEDGDREETADSAEVDDDGQ